MPSKMRMAVIEPAQAPQSVADREVKIMRVALDDIKESCKTKVKMEYWNAGVEADKKLPIANR